jgi:ABC-type multidrug transport system permease subunit
VSNSDQSITSLTDLRNNVNVSQTNVAKALIDLDASNISSSIKNELKSSLDIASAELLLATDLILENGTTGVTGIITKLQEDLDVTRTKLTDAGTAITNSNSNLETISTTLQDAIQSLDSVNSALGEAINVMQTQSDTNAQTVANPLITTITPVTEKSTYLNYLFPTLLILVIMFGSLLLGTTLVMTEKNSPAFLRNFFLPIKKVTFVMSTYITSIILTVIQIIVILGISLIFLPDAISSFPALALILFLTASIFSFLGMIIGYAFTSDETGILASVSLGSLLLFFSGSILPLEAASSAVRGIIQFNPFVIAERLVRGFLLFDASFSLVWMDILILVGYVIVLFFTILVLESLLHKHLVYRFMKHHHKRHKAKDKMTK